MVDCVCVCLCVMKFGDLVLVARWLVFLMDGPGYLVGLLDGWTLIIGLSIIEVVAV